MTSTAPETWISHARNTFQRYDESLLRHVAHKLCKPRNQWPVEELIDRLTAALNNAAMIDRRLKEMPAAGRQILAIIGMSRQPRWAVGSLVEMIVCLGHEDGLAPLVTLLESGLLLPEGIEAGRARLKDFNKWLARSEPMPVVLALPLALQRAEGADLGIACPEEKAEAKAAIHEADGLEWPLRTAVLWQQVLGAPLRRTQQGEYFKRDHDRLHGEPLLSAQPSDALALCDDPGYFAAALATSVGLLRDEGAERVAGDLPAAWKDELPQFMLDWWAAMPGLQHRHSTPADGQPATGNPFPSANLMAMVLLSRLPAGGWTSPKEIEKWLAARHPYWAGKKAGDLGIATFLLSVAFSFRWLQATKAADDGWLVRLSPLGRWMMGLDDEPPALPSFKQTLLVQPNLEILAYRQGLTPELISSLSKFATWKTLGPACTLQLEPHSVYRALEMGETLTGIIQLLEGHGMKAIPPAVLDSLKTWSSKRERLTVYPAGAIFEFASAAEMNDALARGLPATRLTERLAVVASENDIDYKHFRLTGTRDYTLPPEKCVEIEADGVTLNIDLARSDLLLETELQRFAEAIPQASNAGRRQYRLTPASIASARQHNVQLPYLQTWFAQRTGLPISAAALLLMTGPDAAPVELKRQLVLHVANEHLADGLQQWPSTRPLIQERLGPTRLAVAEDDVPLLMERLKELSVAMRYET